MDIKSFIDKHKKSSRGASIWLSNNKFFIDVIKSHISSDRSIDTSNMSNRELIYILVNDIKTIDKCKSCDKLQTFSETGGYYLRTCGDKKCTKLWRNSDEYKENVKFTNKIKYGTDSPNSSEIVKEKKKVSYLRKYGVDNPSKSPDILDKIKNTSIHKYGVDNPAKSDVAKQSYKDTCNKKYGVPSHLNDPTVRKKILDTCIDRYGVDNPFKVEEIQNKIKNTLFEKYGDTSYKRSELFKDKLLHKLKNIYPNIIQINEDLTYKVKCDNCNCQSNGIYNINKNLYYQRVNVYKTEPCIFANPIISNTSSYETELFEYLSSLYSDIVQKDRTILNGKEIDIFIPKLKLGFEFNGVYWHSELHKERNYHQEKTKLALNSDINLMHIWEDDWLYKNEIVKSMITHKLGLSERIGARKCEIRIVNTTESKKFLIENHLQGNVNSSVKIGLFYNNELVSLMTFGKLRKTLNQTHIKNEWELYRYANKLNTNVQGGFSRLLNYFIRNYNPTKIHTYASLDHSSGNVYFKNGFSIDHLTSPGYYWVVNSIRQHRYNFRKDLLVKAGADPNKTEMEIMYEKGHYRIWDSGNIKFIKKIT